MNHYVSEALRRLVSIRAEHLCEYCLIDIADTFFSGEFELPSMLPLLSSPLAYFFSLHSLGATAHNPDW